MTGVQEGSEWRQATRIQGGRVGRALTPSSIGSD
jgi:hypothetical protein